MHAADPDRCIRQGGKTPDLIGLECSEKDILKMLWPAEEISAGHSFYVLNSGLAFHVLHSRLTFRVLSRYLAFRL